MYKLYSVRIFVLNSKDERLTFDHMGGPGYRQLAFDHIRTLMTQVPPIVCDTIIKHLLYLMKGNSIYIITRYLLTHDVS